MHYVDMPNPAPWRGRNWARNGGRNWTRFDMLARNPAEKVIIVTYSEPLARDIAYRVRAILQAP
jgi:hypothetical protein